MVNKILKVGNQIISVGNAVVNTPNPELEVAEINVSKEVSALCGSKITKGDLIAKFDDVTELTENSHISFRNPFAYHCRFFEEDGELCCEIWESGAICVHVLRDGKWVIRSGRDTQQSRHKGGLYGTRVVPFTFPHEYEGGLAYAVGGHLREYGRWPNMWARQDEDGMWTMEAPMGMDQLDEWPDPEIYSITNDFEYRRQIEGASVFQDSSGNAYGFYAGYGSGVYSEDDYVSDWGGRGNFYTYSIDTSTGRWTQTTHDTSCPNRYTYGGDFIEVSGSVYLCVGYEDRYYYNDTSVPNDELNSSHWYSNYTIYKWNPTTQHWDFHQFNKIGNRAAATMYSLWSHHLDASTHIFERRNSGQNYPIGVGNVPLIYEASSGLFKDWGYLDRRECSYPTAYSSKTFKYNDEYYLFIGGATQHRFTLEGSSYGSTPGSNGYNQHPDYMDGTTWEREEYSLLRLMKYNPSTDKWDRQLYDDLTFRHRRVAPGTLYNSTQYIRGVDAYEYGGKMHLVAAADNYGSSIAFWEFDGSSLIKENQKTYAPNIALDYFPSMDDITQSGTIYRAFRHNHYPYISVATYDLSGDASGYWKPNRYMPDSGYTYTYGDVWYEASDGELYVIAGYNSTPRVRIYNYDKQLGQLKKLSDDNVTTSATLPTANVYNAFKVFNINNKNYVTMGQAYGLNYMFEIVEDASSVPYLVDTSTTLPTLQGGTITPYGDHVVKYDGKIWYGRSPYNAPYYGPQIERWDGTASSFTEIDIASPRLSTSSLSGYDTFRNTNYMNRSRNGVFFFEFQDGFYMWSQHDQWPFERIMKYEPSEDKFVEKAISDYSYRPTTHQNSPGSNHRMAVWNNKVWWVSPMYGNENCTGSILNYWDGSGPIQYFAVNSMSSNQQWGQDGHAHLYVNPENELEIHISHQSSRSDSCKILKVNQEYIDNGGKVWYTIETSPPLRKALKFGVALESGNKGDTIQVREVHNR